MRYALSLLTAVAWALWLGGLMALFLFVSHLFKVDRPTAVVAAPQIFDYFEKYQLVLAAVGLVSVFGWRMVERRGWLIGIFTCFALAAVGAVVVAAVITPPMQRLRVAGESSGPQFKKLHGQSMMIFSSEVLLLTVAGAMLPAALTPSRRQTAPGSDPRSAPPA